MDTPWRRWMQVAQFDGLAWIWKLHMGGEITGETEEEFRSGIRSGIRSDSRPGWKRQGIKSEIDINVTSQVSGFGFQCSGMLSSLKPEH